MCQTLYRPHGGNLGLTQWVLQRLMCVERGWGAKLASEGAAFVVAEELCGSAECSLDVAGDRDVGGRRVWGAPHCAEPPGPKEVSYGE